MSNWLALDIGGANLKAAHSAGQVRTIPFELWKRPEDLPRVIQSLSSTFPTFEHVAVTMTAELCDCYPTKSRGVIAVLEAVETAIGGREIQVWGTDAQFHTLDAVRRSPLVAAAANWLALATHAARLIPEGPALLIDIGSTTTDLIPLIDGRVAAQGRTDTQRLQSGELVYAGVRRTPICALATELPFRGVNTGLAAELFAATMDIYLVLGDTEPDPHDLSTADGRSATVESARARLARMIGADRDDFSLEDAVAFAQAADLALMTRLILAATTVCLRTIGKPERAIVAGSGEFLGRRLARKILVPDPNILSLQQAWGQVASDAACAYALVSIAIWQQSEERHSP